MENSCLITPTGASSLKNLEWMASHHIKKNQWYIYTVNIIYPVNLSENCIEYYT